MKPCVIERRVFCDTTQLFNTFSKCLFLRKMNNMSRLTKDIQVGADDYSKAKIISACSSPNAFYVVYQVNNRLKVFWVTRKGYILCKFSPIYGIAHVKKKSHIVLGEVGNPSVISKRVLVSVTEYLDLKVK